MSVLAAETQSIHISLKPNPALSSMSFPAELRSPVKSPEIFEQNTLITYVYCFVKSVIGASGTGTNTVAIDNKIQQALDLVKTHLMFALRDEVEVLKEKITELTERITELEDENTILRAHATQETLAQLCQSKQQQQQQHSLSLLNNINTNANNMNVINVNNNALNNNNS